MCDALKALRLATLYCDGSVTLVSLAHRELLADWEDGDVWQDVPHADITPGIERACHSAESLAEYDAKCGDGGSPGFPGWAAIFDYLEKHPEVLE